MAKKNMNKKRTSKLQHTCEATIHLSKVCFTSTRPRKELHITRIESLKTVVDAFGCDDKGLQKALAVLKVPLHIAMDWANCLVCCMACWNSHSFVCSGNRGSTIQGLSPVRQLESLAVCS